MGLGLFRVCQLTAQKIHHELIEADPSSLRLLSKVTVQTLGPTLVTMAWLPLVVSDIDQDTMVHF